MTYFFGPHEEPDRYHLVQLVARGGEGEVWQATITVSGTQLPVAVKLLPPAQVTNIDEWTARWRSQAEILRSLEHPNLVKVREVFAGPVAHEAGSADPASRCLYLVMNWADGTNLEQWIGQHPSRMAPEVLQTLLPIGTALDYLHSGAATGAPVLHRDVKPANVLVDAHGQARLVDFGFAHLDSRPAMTMVGTPSFIAPEVIGGAPATPMSDWYSFGATLYFTLTGISPVLGDAAGMQARLAAVPGLAGRNDIVGQLLAMMSPNPAARPGPLTQWTQSLLSGSAPSPSAGPSVAPWTGAAGAAAVGGAVGAAGTAGAAGPWGGAPSPTVSPPASGLKSTMGTTSHPPASPTHQAPNPQIPVQHSPLPPGMAPPVGGAPGYTPEPTMLPGAYAATTAAMPPVSPLPSYGTVPPSGGAPPAGGEPPSGGTFGKPKKSKKKLLVGVGAIVLVLVLVGAGFLVLGGGSKGDKADTAKGSEAETASDGSKGATSETTAAKASTTVATTTTLPSSLPDVTAMTVADATNKLESIGITVKTLTTLDESKTDGTVVKQDPAGGAAYTKVVTLTVAHQPVITYLSDLKPVTSSNSYSNEFGPVDIDSQKYLHSLSMHNCAFNCSTNNLDIDIEYNLGKAFTTLRATVGLTDESDSNGSVTYEVIGDGRKLTTGTISLGKPQTIDVDVTGVLRVRLHAIGNGESIRTGVFAAWGDAALYSATPPPESLTSKDGDD